MRFIQKKLASFLGYFAFITMLGCDNNHKELRGHQVESDGLLKKSNPANLTFGYEGRDCQIQTRSYSTHSDFCRGLKDSELNGDNCALAERETEYKKHNCGGQFKVEKSDPKMKIKFKVVEKKNAPISDEKTNENEKINENSNLNLDSNSNLNAEEEKNGRKTDDSSVLKSTSAQVPLVGSEEGAGQILQCSGRVDRHGRGPIIDINAKLDFRTLGDSRFSLIPSENFNQDEVQIFVERKGAKKTDSSQINILVKSPSPNQKNNTDWKISLLAKSEAFFVEYKSISKNVPTDIMITCGRPDNEKSESSSVSTGELGARYIGDVSCLGKTISEKGDSYMVSGNLSSWDQKAPKNILLKKNGIPLKDDEGIKANLQMYQATPSIQIFVSTKDLSEKLRVLSYFQTMPRIEMNQAGSIIQRTLKCDLTTELNKEVQSVLSNN